VELRLPAGIPRVVQSARAPRADTRVGGVTFIRRRDPPWCDYQLSLTPATIPCSDAWLVKFPS
jgi:hypothetical protein